jgi:hypothetical protein
MRHHEKHSNAVLTTQAIEEETVIPRILVARNHIPILKVDVVVVAYPLPFYRG